MKTKWYHHDTHRAASVQKKWKESGEMFRNSEVDLLA